MEEKELRRQICETGRELLRDGLVARTWGNVSARMDKEHFLITPSGLSYLQTTEADLALYHPADKTYEGPHKPSSEKGIHAAAYEIFPEVNFVIHTHQTYASALGVYGFENMTVSGEEKKKLGGIALAEYGLPGTGKLKNAVTKAFRTGAHTVLMKHHGVVIAAESKEEAYERAVFLEGICKGFCRGLEGGEKTPDQDQQMKQEYLLGEIQKTYPGACFVKTDAAIRWSERGKILTAQLDDMAQMIGRNIETVGATAVEVVDALEKGKNSVFVKNLGAVVCGLDEEDTQALGILVDKAAVCALNTEAAGVKQSLGFLDSALMRFVYKKKYSKQKNG